MDNWTPKPGELVLVTATGNWELWRDTTADRLSAPVVGKHGLCKPLLPAVTTPDEAWEALKGLPGANSAGVIILEGTVLFIDKPDLRVTAGLKSLSENYAARGRDYQKEGAIREWLKQVRG